MPDGFGQAAADPLLAVRWWLYGVAALVFALIVVGGATRLTDSGLSITEWRPIMGILPPLSAEDWHEAFEKYRQIPEYKLVNKGMTLDAFKFIFWWEWAHRFLARLVGFAFAIPLAYFVIRRRIPVMLTWKLVGLFAFGGLQGAIGWYMVRSGLVERIDVSHYRLALHLTTAFLIFALLLWAAWSLLPPRSDPHTATGANRRPIARFLLALIFLQVVLGALVAGLKAGLTHNTWPLMDGAIVPSGLGAMTPWYLNLFENVTTVQFNHRMAAYLIVAVALWNAVSILRAEIATDLRLSAVLVAAATVAQSALGVATLLAFVPLSLGLAHQGFAAIVTALASWHLFVVSRAD